MQTRGSKQQVTFSQADGDRRPDRTPVWAWTMVIALWLIPLAAAPFGGLNLDVARDMYWAWQIASGQQFPLIGPMIGFFVHLGPGWFYVLAVPLVFHSSYTGAALFVSLLAGLKYPLAFVLGARLFDWRLGLLWAALLALPALSYFTHLAISHFALVETTLLLFLFCCLRDFRKRSSGTAFLAGLCFSVMLHAHPTTIALAWLLPVLLWNRGKRWPSAAGLITAGTMLPFLPLLFTQFAEAPRDLQAVVDYLQTDVVLSRLADVPALLYNTLAVGMPTAWGLAASDSRALVIGGVVVLIGLGAVGLAGIPAAWRDAPLKTWLLGGLLGYTLFGLQVALLRADTWWYMMLGSLPLLTLAWAAAILALARRRGFGMLVPATAALALAMLLVHGAGLVRIGISGGQHHFPTAKLKDLKAPQARGQGAPTPWLPYWHVDEMARVLCGHPHAVVVHGALALQADASGGTATDLHCGTSLDVFIRGRPEEPHSHELALGPRVVERMPFAPASHIGSFGRYPVKRSIYPEAVEPLASARQYLPRDWFRGLTTTHTMSFETDADELLVISNPLIWWWQMALVSVEANSTPATRVAGDAVSDIYACSDCSSTGTIEWQIVYRAAEGHALDVVSVSPQTRREDPTLGPRALATNTQRTEAP